MKKRLISTFLAIIILSLLTALALSGIGKYWANPISYSSISFWALTGFYSILLFLIQILACFWIFYFIANYMLNKKLNIFFTALVCGAGTLAIAALLAKLRIETYYYEPFKHSYQVWALFFTGFFYPVLYKSIKKRI